MCVCTSDCFEHVTWTKVLISKLIYYDVILADR